MEIKEGDRVRHVEDGDGSFGEGEVVRTGRNKVHVDWFNDSLDRKVPSEDLELVEDQPNRTIYEQDAVDPGHYKFPGGAEVIDITRHLGFLEGNVIKYVARAGRKSDRLSDLLKARRYLDWAIENEESK